MAGKKKPTMISTGVIARNKKAFFNYEIIEKVEAGIVLLGSEVKSLRKGQASISESYAIERDGEMFLTNMYIPEYCSGVVGKFDTRRDRKLLLHKKEISDLTGKITKDGVTIIPLELMFNEHGKAKVIIGVGVGKKKFDKRKAAADKDWERDKARILKHKQYD